jgi:hypothetical protein
MSFTLSDKQRELLSAAAEREDRLLAIPRQLKGAAAQKVAAKLVAASLAKEVKAKTGAPDWRHRLAAAHGARRAHWLAQARLRRASRAWG